MPEEQSNDNNQPAPANLPGAVITPGSASTLPPTPAPNPTPPVETTPTPAPPPAPIPIPPQPAQKTPPPQPPAAEPPSSAKVSPNGVSWQAPEFVAHDKSANWYLGLAVGAAAIAALIYLITKDAVSAAVIIVAALFLGIYGARKPRLVTHAISQQSITINGKTFSYDQFKSFSIKQEGILKGIIFMPLKRFAPMITIYYYPQDEEKILAVLANSLPYEEPRRDTVDNLMQRIRF